MSNCLCDGWLAVVATVAVPHYAIILVVAEEPAAASLHTVFHHAIFMFLHSFINYNVVCSALHAVELHVTLYIPHQQMSITLALHVRFREFCTTSLCYELFGGLACLLGSIGSLFTFCHQE